MFSPFKVEINHPALEDLLKAIRGLYEDVKKKVRFIKKKKRHLLLSFHLYYFVSSSYLIIRHSSYLSL